MTLELIFGVICVDREEGVCPGRHWVFISEHHLPLGQELTPTKAAARALLCGLAWARSSPGPSPACLSILRLPVRHESRISPRARLGRTLYPHVPAFPSQGPEAAGTAPCSAWGTVRASLVVMSSTHRPRALRIFGLRARSKEEIAYEVTYSVNISPLCFPTAFIDPGQ